MSRIKTLYSVAATMNLLVIFPLDYVISLLGSTTHIVFWYTASVTLEV